MQTREKPSREGIAVGVGERPMLYSIGRLLYLVLSRVLETHFGQLKSEGSPLNAVMNIQVRVINGNARTVLRTLRTDIDEVDRAIGRADRSAMRSSRGLTAWGSQLQWTGRQIQTNFTLPLVAAGAAAMHWQLQNEQAMTRVAKVYGDASLSAATMRNELEALSGAFKELSNHFGVQQSEVLSIAGDWAAAGSSGLALAKSVETTLQAMVLGELEAAEATQALIAIQAQYGLSSAKLAETIGILNAVENQTGISMKGLILGFQRSAGVARTAGVDVRHLAAMLAAISPAAGGAAEAGNALKTIFSRLASPTRETSQVLGLMGISMTDMKWKSATATEQLQIMAKKFETLSDKQREVVSTVVASRWQINKFSILMRELNSETGYYQKALAATASRQHVFNLYQKELNTVLSSNPRRLQIIWTMLQNAASDIIQPMIPMILYLANAIRLMVQAFAGLDPALQKLVLFGVLGVALLGPLIRYVGSLATVIGLIGPIVMAMLLPVTSTFGLIVAATVRAGAALRLVWLTVWLNLYGITAVGMATLRGIWAAGLLGLRAYMSIASMIILTRWRSLLAALPATLAAAQIAIRTLWINMLLGMAAIQIGAGAIIRAAWTAMMIGIAATSSVVYPVIMQVWTMILTGVFMLVNVWNRLTLVAYRVFAMGLPPIAAAGGAVLAATWRAVQTAIQVALLAGTIVHTALWRAWVFGLAPITAAAGRVLTAIWVMTLRAQMVVMAAAQRAWAVAWSGMVAIAAAGSRAIAIVTTLATSAMTLLTTLPMRLAAVFRSGWAVLLLITRAGITGLASMVMTAVGAISWPVVAVVAAVVLVIAGFWDQLKTIWNNVINYFQNSGNGLATSVRNIFGSLGSLMSRVFNKLPDSVKNAMVAVVRLVATAARKVYELFSYINPFAHHSPSLVENVTNGMAAVRAQFATLSTVEKYVKSAYGTISQFGVATSGLAGRNQSAEFAEKRKSIVSQAPSAGPAFDAMVAQIYRLTPLLTQLRVEVAAQQSVVDEWSKALAGANASLDLQQKKLDGLRNVAQALQDQLGDAKSVMDSWAETPIEGQQAMSDAIFANTMAQKQLQLQMMDMEEVVGPLDAIKNKMSSINGEIDQLQGMRTSLQQGGAGSDILSFYDTQISSLQGQGSGLSGQAKALQDLQNELDKLAKAGQRLDLENSLKFDPLTRQIEAASKSMKEMPFEQILAGVKSSKAEVDRLTQAYDKANEAVKQQQAIVDAAAAARDAIQARYDLESDKLSKLKDDYDLVNQAIQDINSSLNDMAQAADAAVSRGKEKKGDALSPGAENFLNAEGGDFPDPGSDSAIGREGGIGDQSAQIDDFTKSLAKETSGMFAGLNPLGPLKRWWDRAWDWLKTYIGPLFTGLGDFIGKAFSGIDIPNPFAGKTGGWLSALQGWVDPAIQMFTRMWETITSVFSTLWDWISTGWKFIAPLLGDIWDNLVDGLIKAWDLIRPEIAKFKDLLAPLGEVFANLWTIIKPILAIIAGALAAAFLLVVDIVKNTIEPLLETIGGIIAGVIRVIRGVIEFIVGVFTLDWEMAWNGIKDILGGVWDILGSIIKGAWNLIWGILAGAIEWLTQIFGLIWDKAIKPAWNAAWGWLSAKAEEIWDDIVNYFKGVWNWLTTSFANLWNYVKTAWNVAWSWLKDQASQGWDNIMRPLRDAYNWVRYTFSDAFTWVSDKFRSSWKGLTDWFKDAAGWIAKPLKDAINWVLGYVNKLIDGLNKVADVLPGLDWHINGIPLLAAGGGIPSKAVGSGFKTNGPRAIVGEGNQRYPEYVIPTDPQYRHRASGLFQMLAADIGMDQALMGQIPAYAKGGVLGSISDAMGSAGDFFKGLGSDALGWVSDGLVNHVMKPIMDMADPMINKIPWDYAKGAAKAFKGKMIDWISVADEAAKKKVEEGGAAGVPAGQIRDWIVTALGIIKESTRLAKGIYNIIMNESGGNPRAINEWDSNAAQGYDMMSKGLMQTIGPTFRAYAISGHGDIWNPIDNIIAGTRYAISRYGRTWLENGGNRDKDGNYIGYKVGGVLGNIPSLAEGAYIRRKVGGTLVRVGEGAHDEAVVPLPNGAKDLKGGGRTLNFYGDMSFPNVTSASDAKAFIDNLETLTAR